MQEELIRELFAEAKENIQTNLLSKYSRESFLKIMTEYNIKPRTIALPTLICGSDTSQISFKKLVYDINTKKLRQELSKDKSKTTKLYTAVIALNDVTSDYETFIHPNIGKSVNKPMDLLGCLQLKPESNLIIKSTEYISYFDEKLAEYTEDGRFKKVEDILNLYEEIYLLQMKHS